METPQLWQTVLLGLVQGLAEFLPVSSSGHLVILQSLMDLREPLLLTVVLHLGTLGSILLVYRRDVRQLLARPVLVGLIVLATLPAVAVGLPFEDFFDRTFSSPLVAGCGLLGTAAVLLLGQRLERARDSLETMRPLQALLIGACQAVALLPGVSRSGSTIAGGLCAGLRRESATAFSFLIAIPAIAGACVLKGRHLFAEPPPWSSLGVLLAGAATSFFVGWLALELLIRWVNRGRLHWFAYYCLGAGTLTILWQLTQPAAFAPLAAAR